MCNIIIKKQIYKVAIALPKQKIGGKNTNIIPKIFIFKGLRFLTNIFLTNIFYFIYNVLTLHPPNRQTGSAAFSNKDSYMLKIRLARRGRKRMAIYDIVVAPSHVPRDGRFIEKLGVYNPNTNPATIVVNEDRALYWLLNGGQGTPTVRAILSYRGVMYRKHLQIGVNKGAITQEQADTKLADWKTQKDAKVGNKVENLSTKKEAEIKARFDAEVKIKEARTEAVRQKQEAEQTARIDAERAKADAEKASSDAIKASKAAAEVTETPAAE